MITFYSPPWNLLQTIPTCRQRDSSPISAGSPWVFTAIGPEHTQVQERASFFLCFPSIYHFSRAVSRRKCIPVRCFSSHENKAHPPPSGRGPDREERLKKNSQSSVVQKAVAWACGRHSTTKPSKKKRYAEKGIRVFTCRCCLREKKKKNTSTNRVKRMCWTSDDRRLWGWKYWCLSQRRKVLDLGKEERAGCPHPWGGEGEGGSRCWLPSDAGGHCQHPPQQPGNQRL